MPLKRKKPIERLYSAMVDETHGETTDSDRSTLNLFYCNFRFTNCLKLELVVNNKWSKKLNDIYTDGKHVYKTCIGEEGG